MKSSSKLTIRFILYFILFYLFIIIGTIGSIVAFFFYISGNTGNDIHLFDGFEFEDEIIKEKNSYKLSDYLIEQAEDNSGQLYLVNNAMKVLDYTGETCELCNMTKEEILALDTKGLHTWKLSNHYLLFVPKSPLEPLFNKINMEWTSTASFSSSLQKELEKHNISVELYDERWKRETLFGESKPLVHLPDIVQNNSDIFEQKEWLSAKSLSDGSTLVARMPNDYYQPFEEHFNKGMLMLIFFFVVFHIILLIGIILLSFGISNRFVRPIVYILSRIGKLAKFDYNKSIDERIHHKKTGKLKRKYKLFQPIDDSIDNLTNRLAYNERQIKRAEQLREEWITGLSHDLKTPLSSIYGYSTMLSSSDYNWSSEETREFAATMREKANYMDALIQDLTYTYQLKNKAVQLSLEKVDLAKWLAQFQDDQVSVQTSGNVIIEADKLLLYRIIENIVGNAKKHTPTGTPIKITAWEENFSVILSVKDYGSGIPQEDLDNLFERYYRGTNTTDDLNGTGLGLAITKQLIDMHNAEIDVLSNEGGTEFKIRFGKANNFKDMEGGI
ncbi:HAMP domain-containing sensor histidine kinase [Lysinibacillus telephonicus]|uniref:sensor histidine kinase n=1 Tax=Lysinibacillus telephonicus TaxID=1714840 RepID=UPI0031FBE977